MFTWQVVSGDGASPDLHSIDLDINRVLSCDSGSKRNSDCAMASGWGGLYHMRDGRVGGWVQDGTLETVGRLQVIW